MGTFPDIVVDPYLVCLPRPCQRPEQLDDFVNSLLAWSELLQGDRVRTLFPESCLQSLMDEGHYPYGHELKQMAKRLGSAHISDDFVCRVAQDLLDRTPTLEEHCSIGLVIFDEESCHIEPEIYLTRLTGSTRYGFKHGLAIVACFQQKNSESSFLLASAKSSPEEAFREEVVRISAHIEQLDAKTDAEYWSKILPVGVDHSLPVAFSHNSVLEYLGCLRLWGTAQSPDDAQDAIATRIEELLAIGTGDRSAVKTFRVGEQFLASARQNAFGSRTDLAMNLIESSARIAVGVPKHPVEEFREDERPSSAQRKRADGAVAWRTHLTKHGPGFRLMFWELRDGTIELANVGTKFELEIL